MLAAYINIQRISVEQLAYIPTSHHYLKISFSDIKLCFYCFFCILTQSYIPLISNITYRSYMLQMSISTTGLNLFGVYKYQDDENVISLFAMINHVCTLIGLCFPDKLRCLLRMKLLICSHACGS